ncbi:hypothetical protein HYN59_17080 [Flavobacterium album]|uniref:Uncharacterized protein n=1 Tax=Flavobacterium album TaxID=2175091 RepID=A0A2S1R1W4_9FLAO|nr:hypothetical protein [Flavobacterium album]AWH86713.1 hypothetical protein HYN59_17080 [Flavobacterium album]
MAPGGTDDPKDLGSKKIGNQEKQSDKNEGFSGDNLPKNYDPSKDKLKMELEKNEDGDMETVQRARDVDEKQAPPVSLDDKTTRGDGAVVDKSRGTANEAQDVETAENRDFNSDVDEDRYPASHPDNHKHRGNTHVGDS